MKTILDIRDEGDVLLETRQSDRYEKEVADYVNAMKDWSTERPKVSTKYSDVLIKSEGGEQSWLEVKMNHTDNLANPRIYFDGRKWATTYSMKSAHKAVEIMNKWTLPSSLSNLSLNSVVSRTPRSLQPKQV